MGRKIIKQLFDDSNTVTEQETITLSLKDWKELMSRLDHLQAQVSNCNEKTERVYLKMISWLLQVKKKLDAAPNTYKYTEKPIEQNPIS